MKYKKRLLGFLISLGLTLTGCSTLQPNTENLGPDESLTDDKFFRADFVNYDDSYLYSTYVLEGECAEYDGQTPKRSSTDTYMYEFTGWDKDLKSTPIYSNTKFIAQYEEILIQKCIVQFVNYDGALLYETVVNSGDDVAYVGETPTRPDDDDGTIYTFSGWSKSLSQIMTDTVITAQFVSRQPRYTVTFVNYDGSILDVQYVEKGNDASYGGQTPEKPPYQDEAYEFSGWDTSLENIQSDITVTAEYTVVDRYVTIVFHSYDGGVLYSATVPYGDSVTYSGPTPTKPVDGRLEFVFDKWSRPTNNCQSDLDVYPIFTERQRSETSGLYFNLDYRYDGATGNYISFYTVSGYNGSSKDIYIPMSHNGYPVRSINSSVFYSNDYIETIFIEDNVDTIYNNNFYSCSKLREVRLPENVSSLPSSLFYNCPKLEKINIPSLVSRLERSMFLNVGNSTYELTISANNNFYKVQDDFVVSKDGKTLLFPYRTFYYQNVTIPRNIEIIEEGAFSNLSILSVTLPNDLKEIRASAFYYCTVLSTVTFGSSPFVIGDNAFESCYNLSSLDFNDSVTSIGNYAFNSCNGLSKVDLGTSLTYLGNNAFYSCYNLKEIKFESNLNSISSNAFAYCSGLKTIEFNDSIKSIGSYAFAYCSGLKNLEFTNSLTTIDSYGFYYCSGLNSVKFPNSLKTINSNAFENCYSLSTIDYGSGIETIGYRAFAYCNSITSLKMPSSLLILGSYAFQSCNALMSLDINNASCSIEEYAFYDCYYLCFLSNYSNVIRIADWAFYYSNIKSFVIYPALTSISPYSFNFYSFQLTMSGESSYFKKYDVAILTADLKSIVYVPANVNGVLKLPKQVTNIESKYWSDSYYGITGFEIESGGSTYKSVNNSLYNASGTTLYFLSKTVTDFSNAPSNLIKIDSYAGRYHDSLVKVDLSDTNVSTLGYECFAYCNNLATVKVKFTSSDSCCFYDCDALTSLTILSGTTNIGYEMFYDCDGLQSVTIPSTVSYLSYECFNSCDSLKTVTIPSSVTSFDSYCFANCSSLDTVYWNCSCSNTYLYIFNYSYIDNLIIGSNVSCFYGSLFGNSCTSSSNYSISFATSTSFYSSEYLGTAKNVYVNGSFNDYIANSNRPYGICGSNTNIYFSNSSGSVSYNGSKYSAINKSATVSTTYVSYNALNGLYLTSVTFSEGVKQIYDYALGGDYSLEWVIFPKSLTSIGYQYYTSFKVFYNGTSTQWNNISKYNTYSNVYYYSQSEPTTNNKYWRYVNGVPTIWVVSTD